jgi:hypothetical protein
MTSVRKMSLSEELCTRAEQKFRHRFANVEELVAVLLTELLRDDAAVMDQDEQRIIEERLKGLGYI